MAHRDEVAHGEGDVLAHGDVGAHRDVMAHGEGDVVAQGDVKAHVMWWLM